MDTCFDLLNWLEPDMLMKVFTSLEDPSDLVRIGAVSRSWRQYEHETEEGMEAGSSSNWMERESAVRDHRVYAFLARCCTSFLAETCIAEAISASSTDNFPEESIENTLDPRELVSRRASYWSSKGQHNPEVPETLIYKLTSDFCVITEISVQPFQAFFQSGMPIYSARGVRFRIGHPKPPGDFGTVPMDEPCDDKFIWTYTSEVFQMVQLNTPQKFKLPKPVLCIGGYLQIELLGRVQRQEMDGLFYICVSHVQVLGRSLVPAFGVEILYPSGKFILKQYLQPDNSPVNLPENKPCPITTVDLERRVRTLQQIVDMFRGNGAVYGWDVDEDESDDEFVF